MITGYLLRVDPDAMPEIFERIDLSPRERLLAVFENPPVSGAEVWPATGSTRH